MSIFYLVSGIATPFLVWKLYQIPRFKILGQIRNRQHSTVCLKGTVDSRYLEVEGTLKNTSRYPYFDISDL